MRVGPTLLAAIAMTTAMSLSACAQFTDRGFEVGVYGGAAWDNNGSDDVKPGLKVRAALAYPLLDPLQVEFGYAFTAINAKDFEAQMFPVDLRLRFCPAHSANMIPYAYGGIGALYYTHDNLPSDANASAKEKTWAAFAPFGAGFQFRLDEHMLLDVHGGYNQTFTKDLNPNKKAGDDSYLTLAVGLRVGNPWGIKDLDGDGLSNKHEKQLGTDPRNPDTDGDGLPDGEEVHAVSTDPRKPDTDGDRLSDADEVRKYKTEPLKVDSDGDALSDGDEVLVYKTDPLNQDSDADGLSDGNEVLTHQTDPLKSDSDGDKLSDGDEVSKYRSNPLNEDTDGGTVDDGAEAARGTNLLNPADDVPKVAITEVGKPIVLKGITFKTNSAEILPESEKILNDVFETLRDNPYIEVSINGYTDATGTREKNLKLSEARANAVKQWLVNKGIDAQRLTAKGFGPDNPIGDNTTQEGRQKNRRIEFVRTK